MAKICIVGSLRNELIQEMACTLREDGHEVIDDWHGAGPRADDHWRDYEIARGRTFVEALRGLAPQMIMKFDRTNIDASDTVILALPAGRSGHIEIGYAIGTRKKTHILLDKDYDRWDVMYAMVNEVHDSFCQLRSSLKATSLVDELVDQIAEEAGL